MKIIVLLLTGLVLLHDTSTCGGLFDRIKPGGSKVVRREALGKSPRGCRLRWCV